jgi:hypothetical protein
VLSQLASAPAAESIAAESIVVEPVVASCESAVRALTKKLIASTAKSATTNRGKLLTFRQYHSGRGRATVKSQYARAEVCTLAATG